MSRLDPKNREEAFTYQFEDDVKVLRCAAMRGQGAFEQSLKMLESHIKAYRSTSLRKQAKKSEQKYKEQLEYVKINYPYLLK